MLLYHLFYQFHFCFRTFADVNVSPQTADICDFFHHNKVSTVRWQVSLSDLLVFLQGHARLCSVRSLDEDQLVSLDILQDALKTTHKETSGNCASYHIQMIIKWKIMSARFYFKNKNNLYQMTAHTNNANILNYYYLSLAVLLSL